MFKKMIAAGGLTIAALSFGGAVPSAGAAEAPPTTTTPTNSVITYKVFKLGKDTVAVCSYSGTRWLGCTIYGPS
jgi:hypothetical protein